MNWKTVGYKGAWYALRGLMHFKKILVKSGRFGLRLISPWRNWYREVIGFRLYKLSFYLKKRAALLGFVRKYTPGHFFAQRYILQLGALSLFLFISWPQTRFYKQPLEYTEVPGRKTLLYALVGPGEQDFATDSSTNEEVLVDMTIPDQSWNEGVIGVEPGGSIRATIYDDVNQPNTANYALVKPYRTKPIQSSGSITPTGRAREIFVYTVKQGDVLGSIANQFGISITTILNANRLTARSIIRPGDSLKILPIDGVSHLVKKGDTISKIALAYGAKNDDIIQFNNFSVSGNGLTIGKEIVVPYGKAIAAAPLNPTKKPPSNAVITQRPVGGPTPGSSQAAPTLSGFIWPSGATIVTQYFGWQHTGMDIAGKVGLPNYAAKSGTVVKSQCGWNGGYGCYVILDHGNGVQTLYGHNTQLLVSPGEYVTQGQVVGLLGNTGRSTGPHLHFEVRINGKRVNPLGYIKR